MQDSEVVSPDLREPFHLNSVPFALARDKVVVILKVRPCIMM